MFLEDPYKPLLVCMLLRSKAVLLESQVVTPWTVSGNIDYNKLVEQVIKHHSEIAS